MKAFRVFAGLAAFFLLVVSCGDTVSVTTEPPTPTDPDVTQAPIAPGVPDVVPDVDLSIHVVPLEEIYFDTFDGDAVPLSESDPRLRRRLLDAIPPIDEPVYGDLEVGEWLSDDDLVIGYLSGTAAYAYPLKILNFHEIVNDVIDGVPVLVSYCPLCRSGIVYDRRVDGRTLSFGNTSALYESDLVMVDRQTGSYWWQVPGKAIVGTLTGAQLTPLPSVTSTWGEWTGLHPETLVLSRDTGYNRTYEHDPFAGYQDSVNAGRFAFPVGAAAEDARLTAGAIVLGIEIDGAARAYPLETLGDALTFTFSNGRYLDDQTGSRWSLDGRAIGGDLVGTRLEALPSRTTFWFAFVGAFPRTDVYVPLRECQRARAALVDGSRPRQCGKAPKSLALCHSATPDCRHRRR